MWIRTAIGSLMTSMFLRLGHGLQLEFCSPFAVASIGSIGCPIWSRRQVLRLRTGEQKITSSMVRNFGLKDSETFTRGSSRASMMACINPFDIGLSSPWSCVENCATTDRSKDQCAYRQCDLGMGRSS